MRRVRGLSVAVVLGAAALAGAAVAHSDTGSVTISGAPAATLQALDPAGREVSYTAQAVDSGGNPEEVACDGPGGASDPDGTLDVTAHFPLGTTTVSCTGTDGATASFSVTVQDTQAPSLTPPADPQAEATGPGGAIVSFAPTATDTVDSSPSVECTSASGSVFPIGSTPVSCTAHDASGNASPSVPFNVTVTDTVAPTLSLPPDQAIEATSSAGTALSYTATANDTVSGAVVADCMPASGSVFPIGSTTVSCHATDGHANTSNGSFAVTVTDTVPPVLAGVPTGIQVEANGPAGSAVNFASPTATDTVDGPLAGVSCAPGSGSTFPLGATTVTCSATDTHGNVTAAAFAVAVLDTTPPHLIAPGDWTVYATTPSGIGADEGTAPAFLGGASATDLADPNPSITTNAPAFFPVGATEVTFVARDASGNTSTASAVIHVRPQPAPGTTSPPLPPPGDRQPPGDVGGLKAIAGDGRVALTWQKPSASDFAGVVVTRSLNTGEQSQVVFRGATTAFTDRGVANGTEYRYVVVAVDKAGNSSGGVVAVALPRRSELRAPRDGAKLRQTPTLAWNAFGGASYYNVQLFRGSVKVLSAWPMKPSLALRRAWAFDGKRYRLTPGLYRWFVWPAFGVRASADYGDLLGSSTFQVVG